MNGCLPDIPLIDIRDGGPPLHARLRAARARALRDACLGFFPAALLPLMPLFDRSARRRLERASSPYLDEIAEMAATLDFSGVWLLNGVYQWACTAHAREERDGIWLVRTLDWPFHGLGRYVEVTQMRGRSGEFYNVTWPGYAGVLTAMAPGRFAASINQAPMRRRFQHPWLRPFDLATDVLPAWAGADGAPPDQLLRQAFELCEDYRSARKLLESGPVARPVIFTLAGCAAGECCVIERTETDHVTREHETSAANDWLPRRPGWEGRIGARRFLSCSFAEAAGNSRVRREALAAWSGSFADPGFAWVREPVLNPYTRLAIALCPGRGILRVIGYDATGAQLPEPVTQSREIASTLRLQPA